MIPHELQMFMWQAIDQMPEPKDYFQVIRHISEQPAFDLTYILTANDTAVTAKVYVIDSEDYCTMLLVEEY